MAARPTSTEARPPAGPSTRKTIYKGRKFDFEVVTFQRGGKTVEREYVRHPGAVVIVPVLDDGRIVLIRNLRFGIGPSGERLWECCAGTLEPGEEPSKCAARELIEETGYEAKTLTPLAGGWFYTTPGMTDERMHAFVATGLRHVGQDLEDDESITVELVPAAKTLSMIESGELRDGKSIVALLLAERKGLLRGTKK